MNEKKKEYVFNELFNSITTSPSPSAPYLKILRNVWKLNMFLLLYEAERIVKATYKSMFHPVLSVWLETLSFEVKELPARCNRSRVRGWSKLVLRPKRSKTKRKFLKIDVSSTRVIFDNFWSEKHFCVSVWIFSKKFMMSKTSMTYKGK